MQRLIKDDGVDKERWGGKYQYEPLEKYTFSVNRISINYDEKPTKVSFNVPCRHNGGIFDSHPCERISVVPEVIDRVSYQEWLSYGAFLSYEQD